ncbi:phosphate ABC transporter substrate-binding protein PstS [Actinomycetaceae bacterium MB13-C1-2]|nr:phosphate ABC transporter substrate-binding protein PstS [Actinomycetaceae bacterium MB13-C1-2]
MKQTRNTRAWMAGTTLAISTALLAGCAANEGGTTPSEGQSETTESASTLSGTFAGAGASAQEAAQAAWIAAFQSDNPDVTINYNPVGSGGGRKQFIEGATVYAGSDSYLKVEELEGGTAGACAADSEVYNLPVYISPIAVVFSLDGIESLNMDAATIAKIFKGEITTWNDPAIAESNPDTELPQTAITVVHRSDDSGTTKNFSDYLNKNVPEIWDAEPEDKYPYSFPGAEGAQGSSGVVDAVAGGAGTIGYVDASKAGGLSSVALKVGDDYVHYSPEGAAAIVDASPRPDEGQPANDLAVKVDRTTTEAGVYPLVLVSYLIVCQNYADAKNGEFVKAYADYIVSPEGQTAAQEGAGSAPISDATRDKILPVLETIK